MDEGEVRLLARHAALSAGEEQFLQGGISHALG
jgi:hypothetical protein